MATMPPASKFSGPPPGATPQGISSMLPPGRFEEDPMESNPSGGGGGLKDVFDEVSAVLDSLAGILPDYAEEIDSIKTQLAEVLAKAISGGASFTGNTNSEPIRGSEGIPA
jgi:hypothetical protein